MGNSIKIILFLILLTNFIWAKKLDNVTLQLQWLDQFQFAGFYIAKEKGFYEEKGLNVEILKYSNDLNILENVTTNKSTFAIGRTSLLIHKNKGFPIVALAAIFQHSPSALLVTDKTILTPSDLIKKRVMISQDAITSASYMSMLFSEGIINDDINVQKHSFDVNDLVEGRTDAIASYISNEPYKLEKQGIPYKYFHPKDFGFDFYGDILYTSEYQVNNHPQRVEDFTKASLKGWEYAFDNIEESAKLIFDKYNTQNKTLDELIYEGTVLKTLAYNNHKKLGHIDEKKFIDIAKTYRLLGLIDKSYNLENFIYEIHCNINHILNQEEEKWLKDKKILKLGTNKSWNPIEFFDNGQFSGIASGYLKILENKLDVKIELIKDTHWFEVLLKTKNKQIDFFLSIVETPNRKSYMNFTKPYLIFPTTIVTRNDVGYIRDIKQLTNRKVAVEKGFYTHELISKYNPNIQVIPVNTTLEALKEVYNENAYAYIGALPSSGHFIQESKLSNLKINGEAPFDTKLSFASRKDLKLLNLILNKTLNSITQKEHEEIYNKWLNVEYKKEVDYTTLILIVIILLLVLIILYHRNRDLKNITETDNLTEIANRRKVDSYLEMEVNKAKRDNHTMSIIFIDIDFFKNINDKYGHKTGDKILKFLAKILEKNIRGYELIGRWGGEEFIIVCPNSNLTQSITLAKKLSQIVENTSHIELNKNNITISCGVAQYINNESYNNLIHRADLELYKAKENGRNCTYPKI